MKALHSSRSDAEVTFPQPNTDVAAGDAPASAGAPVGARSLLQVRGLRKQFVRQDGTRVPAIDDVSFDLHAGEFMVLLGPSGCGKTTLLRAVAGLETPDSGSITIEGKRVYSSADRINVPPERRNLSMVFQSYALWPHMTVFQNVAYPLRSGTGQRLSKAEITERVERMLTTMRLDTLGRQYPNQLSGGQQQRVALCRALIAGSNIVLFDEPLSNVDAKVREQLRLELLLMQRELGFAALFVTHDQQEAMALAHAIAVVDRGKMIQRGTPHQIYSTPSTLGVAAFVGVVNTVPGSVSSVKDDEVTVTTSLGPITGTGRGVGLATTDAATVVFRPEDCAVSESLDGDSAAGWSGVVEQSWYYGTHSESMVRVGELDIRVHLPHRRLLPHGTKVRVAVSPSDVYIYRD